MKQMMPAAWLLISLLAMLALRLVLPSPRMVAVPRNLPGLVPVATGAWLNLAADRAIPLAHTTVKPFEAPTALITGGVYGFTRNPMYVGLAAILVGVTVLLGAWIPLAVVIALVAMLQPPFIKPEYQNLQRTFGKPGMTTGRGSGAGSSGALHHTASHSGL